MIIGMTDTRHFSWEIVAADIPAARAVWRKAIRQWCKDCDGYWPEMREYFGLDDCTDKHPSFNTIEIDAVLNEPAFVCQEGERLYTATK